MIPNTEKGRQNGIALLGNFMASIVFTLAFIAEFVKEGRPLWYPIIGVALSWIPVISGTYFTKKDPETPMVKHIIAIGFACIYSFSIFLTYNHGVYVFVFPMILIVCVFNDFKYMAKIILGVVIENLIVAIAGLVTQSAFGYVCEANSVIQIIAVLAMAIASLSVMNALSVNAREKITEMAAEKKHTEKALKRVTKMTDRMNHSIDVINKATNKLTDSADQTQMAMDEVANGAQQTADALQKQMLQTDKIQTRIEDINVEAANVSDSMNATVDVLATGKTDMNNLVNKVEDSVQLGVDVTAKLETLDEYIEKMHTIVGIIGEITSQTSLLALNASIEAARAGEAGKGFAVVAGEITHMATQTQEATTNITDLIDGVSTAINEVVTTVRKMISGINDQKESAENTVSSFANIEKNTLSIQNSVISLQSGMQELETANLEISEYIQKISAISQELTARAGETLEASSQNTESIINISDMVTDLSNLNNEED